MSSIRVYFTDSHDTWADVEDGYSILVEDDGSLGIYDDGDAILAIFKTWDYALNLPPVPPLHVATRAPRQELDVDDEDLVDEDDLVDLVDEDDDEEAEV